MQPGSPKAVSRSTGNSVGSGAAEDSVEGSRGQLLSVSSLKARGRERRDGALRLQALDADGHRPGIGRAIQAVIRRRGATNLAGESLDGGRGQDRA